MFTKSITTSSKALRSRLAKEAKRDPYLRWEHNAAFYSAGDSKDRPGRHNMTQAEFEWEFSRESWQADASGANKVVYLHHPDGTPLQYICIKRDREDGNSGLIEECGIQCELEIAAYEALAENPERDCLCPIFKYFTARSDKAGVEKRRQRVVIVCQKAEYIGGLRDCCIEAEFRNREECRHGYETAEERQARIERLCRKMKWHDIVGRGWGGGHRNCGVIFDYADNIWKAVIVDYAL